MEAESLKETLQNSLESVGKLESKQKSYNRRFGIIGKVFMFIFYVFLNFTAFSFVGDSNIMVEILIWIGFLTLLFVHLRRRKEVKGREKAHLEVVYNEFYDNYIYIPKDFCKVNIVKRFIKYLENMRADSLKECINLYHHETEQEEFKDEFRKNRKELRKNRDQLEKIREDI